MARAGGGLSLRANVLAAIVTATAALVLSLLLLEDPIIEHRLYEHARTELSEVVDDVAAEIDAGGDADEVADRLGARSGSHVLVIGPDGTVLGDTARDGHALRSAEPVDAPEIDTARRTGRAVAHRTYEDDAHMIAAVRTSDGAVVQASRSTSFVQTARRSTRELIVAGGLIAVFAAFILTLMLTRTMVRPIEEITRTADALADGDLSSRTRADRRDELGRLGRALDRMADELQERVTVMQAEEERLKTMLDSMVEAVFVTDATGRVALTNRALDRLTDAPAVGQPVTEAMHDDALQAAVDDARSGEPSRVDLLVETAEGPRAMTAHVTPLPNLAGVVAVLHDVTDLKRAEKVRRDFVANASHELRTPLTAIRGFAETLADGSADDPVTTARFLDAILRHTHRLQRLVDDLLALSRSESPDQHFELGPVDVGPIATEAIGNLEAQAERKRIEVSVGGFDAIPAVVGNAWALDHVLVNLVDNAVKYTPEGGRVQVRARDDGDAVRIEVSDTGPGIPPAKLERVFERFYRVDKGRAREEGGTGLGLAIVKHLVQRMDGEVVAESTGVGGTTFSVRLSRWIAAAAAE